MAFVDEIKLSLKAGHGGNGVERWLHEKGKEYSGPAGGNAGKGGDIYAKAVRDPGILLRYKAIKELKAKKGEDGMRNSMHGRNGDDLYIDFPVGSIITNLDTGKKYSLLKDGETILLLKGGRGGLGNEHFKASTNTRPRETTDGKEGESGKFFIELELFADLGLVGLPNAGKSSLLNALTNAEARVGSYAFTTLEPNLGDLYGYIIADIPGLIEGASEGKGLGHKFLRHIKKTKAILHCVSLENENVAEAYKTVRSELEKYGETLSDKKEIVLLTKSDIIGPKELTAKEKEIKKVFKGEVLSVSVYDDNFVKTLQDYLVKFMREMEKEGKPE